MKLKTLLILTLLMPFYSFAIKYYIGPANITAAAWASNSSWSNTPGGLPSVKPTASEEVRFTTTVTFTQSNLATAVNPITIMGTGSVTIAHGVTIYAGNVKVNGATGSLVNNGTANFKNVTFSTVTPNTAGATITNNGTMNMNNLNVGNGSLYGIYTNNGTVAIVNNLVVEEGAFINSVGASVTSNGISIRSGGNVNNSGTITSQGNTNAAQMEILDGGSFTNTSTGVLNVDLGQSNAMAIRINGNFSNMGTVNVGSTPVQPGSQGILVQTAGDFYSTGTLNFSIDQANCVIDDNHGVNGSYNVTGTTNHIYSGSNCTNLILPVKLLYFTGTSSNGNALLNWATSLEINSKMFEVEQSTDGINFTKIGVVMAKGAASIYSFTATQISEVAYYRLKQVDLDGKFDYSSSIRLVNTKPTKALTVAVNPTVANQNGTYTLSITSPTYRGLATVSTYSSTGALVRTQKLSINNEVSLNTSNVGNLAKGVYYIKVNAGALAPETKTLIVQ